MLTINYLYKKIYNITLILLVSISCITFQYKFVFAGSKSDIADTYRIKGQEAHQRGDLAEALSFYTKAISLGLEDVVLLNDIGILFWDQSRKNERT